MISFDLKCSQAHIFEAWFRSSADYGEQQGAGLIGCPVCGDTQIAKAAMAPAVSAKGNRRTGEAPVTMSANAADDARLKAAIAALAEAQAKMLDQSQWVGDQFAEQARAMHYGEADHALIHGTTSAGEARVMMEEGLPVAPLIVPVAPPDRTH